MVVSLSKVVLINYTLIFSKSLFCTKFGSILSAFNDLFDISTNNWNELMLILFPVTWVACVVLIVIRLQANQWECVVYATVAIYGQILRRTSVWSYVNLICSEQRIYTLKVRHLLISVSSSQAVGFDISNIFGSGLVSYWTISLVYFENQKSSVVLYSKLYYIWHINMSFALLNFMILNLSLKKCRYTYLFQPLF